MKTKKCPFCQFRVNVNPQTQLMVEHTGMNTSAICQGSGKKAKK